MIQHKMGQAAATAANRARASPSLFKAPIIILATVCLQLALNASQLEAKPINQNLNQVKFRRLPPKEFSAALGSGITIECEAGGSPQPTIHWLKNGKRIQQGASLESTEDSPASSSSSSTSSSSSSSSSSLPIDDIHRIGLSATRSRLYIDCADYQDEAVYTCVAGNAYSRISSHTKLNLIKPILATGTSSSDQTNNAVTGENDLASASNLEEVTTLEMANTGVGASEAPRSLSAVAQCLNQRNMRLTEPVRIHMWTHNIIEVMNNNVVLYCRSSATGTVNSQQQQEKSQEQTATTITSSQSFQPQSHQQQTTSGSSGSSQQPNDKKQLHNNINIIENSNNNNVNKKAQVTWTLPDEKQVGPEHKGHYEILESGDLLIKDLSWIDMGSYVCTVSDELSSDSISSFVYPASVKPTSKRSNIFDSRFAPAQIIGTGELKEQWLDKT